MYDLSLRQKGMQKEIKDQSDVITENENYIKAFVNDLLESHQVIHVNRYAGYFCLMSVKGL